MTTLPVDRWLITAKLITCAPMTIGTGGEEKDGDATVNLIELDHAGNPFIPGTALKGLIRRFAASHELGDLASHVEPLLGGMAKERKKESTSFLGLGGSAEFRNAWLGANQTIELLKRGRTAIDRGSRSAVDGMLRTTQAVPEGISFDVEIIVDRACAEQATLLISLLALVDGASPVSSLGSGDGRVKLECINVRHIDSAAIEAWAKEGGNWKKIGKTATNAAKTLTPLGQSASFRLSLQIAGHFLVAQEIPNKGDNKDAPDHIPLDPKIPLLPASSIDGALRAQAERIWRTVHGNPDEDWSINPPPAPLEELFGSRDRSGMIAPSDFKGNEVATQRIDYVAIDRVSGGAKDGAKFAVLAFEAPLLKGAITINFTRKVNHAHTGQPARNESERRLSDAALGLLALTLRDLAEGDVVLGHGTRKGLGEVAALGFGDGGLYALLEAIAKEWKPNPQVPRSAITDAVAAFRAYPKEHGQ